MNLPYLDLQRPLLPFPKFSFYFPLRSNRALTTRWASQPEMFKMLSRFPLKKQSFRHPACHAFTEANSHILPFLIHDMIFCDSSLQSVVRFDFIFHFSPFAEPNPAFESDGAKARRASTTR